jgi:dihydrofolate synthase/folylpolyglutamate synthase
MGYRESLDYLYGLQRFGIKLGLDNIRGLLQRLDHPERGYAIVHVGGSNGKGSVSAAVARIFQEAGLRVGLYTSPHLHSFTERIQVNGRQIAEEETAALIDRLRSLSQGIPATFFEFTTAMALLFFKQCQVDVAVLEVGMGGRLDATNVVLPQVSVITPVCLDHAEHLGPDLAAIAAEKGGIIKPGTPLVIGRQDVAALTVLQRQAEDLAAPVFLYGRDFSVREAAERFDYAGLDLNLTGLQQGLPGKHQQQNMALALAASELLRRRGWGLSEDAMRRGVEQVRWPGRLEWWEGQRKILLDGAHNEGGATVLADYLRSLSVAGIRWVVGAKAQKEIGGILAPLLPLVSALYATEPPVDTPLAPDEVVRLADRAGVSARAYASPAAALAAALAERRPGEIVLVAGSLFLVAAAREFLLNQETVRE